LKRCITSNDRLKSATSEAIAFLNMLHKRIGINEIDPRDAKVMLLSDDNYKKIYERLWGKPEGEMRTGDLCRRTLNQLSFEK